MIQIGDSNASAASPLKTDTQSWTVMILQGQINEHFRGYLEIQPRFSEDSSDNDRLIIRPAAIYSLSSELTLWAGYAAVGNLGDGTWEHRTWQQLQHEKEFGGVILINRSRFEQRFLNGEDDVAFRLRHMIRALYPFTEDKTWAVVFSDEVFFNLNSVGTSLPAGFDQNRAFLGVNHRLDEHWRVEFGYLNNWIPRPGDQQDKLNHALLIALFYNF